jgi:hypothetical protein
LSIAEADQKLALTLIAYADLPNAWGSVEPLLSRACEHSFGAFTPESVVNGMRDGELIMIGMLEGGALQSIMVATVGAFRTGLRVFECLLVGGRDMKAWMPFEPEMDEFARQHGCARARCIGRKSLTKMLPHWKLVGVMLEREL